MGCIMRKAFLNIGFAVFLGIVCEMIGAICKIYAPNANAWAVLIHSILLMASGGVIAKFWDIS